jgi:hypothetical protein
MTTVPAPAASGLSDAMHVLIDLLDASLAGDDTGPVSDEVRALRRVLHGKHRAQDAAQVAHRFHGGRVCLVDTATSALRAELVDLGGVLLDTWESGLVVLVSGLPQEAGDSRARITRVLTRVHRVAPTASVGVSTPLATADEAARGLDEARRGLALCAPGAHVLADDRWFDVAISRLRDSVRESLAVDGPLSRLDDGLRSGADLRTTLATWLALDGDMRATADRLHLHPNSLRYRLRRATEITGIDLTDPLQRLVAHLALSS